MMPFMKVKEEMVEMVMKIMIAKKMMEKMETKNVSLKEKEMNM